MLNVLEISDLKTYALRMVDSREKELLKTLLFEYEEYIKCGTPDECQQRIEWMSFSIEDIRKKYVSFVKEMREYVAEEIEYAHTHKPKKRGRPPKEKARTDNG